ncbi:MAG: glycosyltransferase family 9 protein [Candidatus Nitronauta litoralis]|uniref:Glycosyltransferase family 9 protein n=1 Tax=Candidatus Nitronauta litoralis TaxID=2705533 RepID=A0A7T0BX91_9BACT|nr:MAG: glycosyltransferase family 9 protein [Candidatus Nitronauta litoralis]
MAGAQKILVVRQGRAGDMVMITPALTQILEGYPGAEVHLVTSPDGRRVLKGFHPRLARFFLYSRRIPKTWWIGPRLVKELKAENYERIFLFETNPHYTDLLNGVCSNLHRITNLEPDVHYCVRCIEVVESNMDNAPKRSWLTLPVTENGQTKAEDLLGRHGVTESTFLVGMHPTYSGMTLPFYRQWGGRKKHRTWPQAYFARLANMLNQHGKEKGVDLKVLVDILPEERPLLEELIEKNNNTLIVLSEPPDFERYKAIIARMNLFVAPDTGPMHMAAALRTPLVALFSGKSPLDCGPYVDPSQFEVVESKGMPDAEKGLSAILPETVFETCKRFLP